MNVRNYCSIYVDMFNKSVEPINYPAGNLYTHLYVNFLNLLYLEHEVLKRVFRVPQNVQKVKLRDSHKSLGFFEQQN